MDFCPATSGQIRQIMMKVLASIPVDSFSFDEAERLIHDGQMRHDIAALLRRHSQRRFIDIVVPTDAIKALRNIDCKFNLLNHLHTFPVDLSYSSTNGKYLTTIFKQLSGTAVIPTEAAVDVISFGPGVLMSEIPPQLTKRGLRPATACEAAGFLQARNRGFTNSGRTHAPHGFQVIGNSNVQLEFTTKEEPNPGRRWEVLAIKNDNLFANEVLVAKL